MLTHSFDLDILPDYPLRQIHLNQYDDDFMLKIHLYASKGEFHIEPGTTVEIRGTKPDKTGFEASAELVEEQDGSYTVEVTGNQQMTDVYGKAIFELTFVNNGKLLSTANFIISIERAAFDREASTGA